MVVRLIERLGRGKKKYFNYSSVSSSVTNVFSEDLHQASPEGRTPGASHALPISGTPPQFFPLLPFLLTHHYQWAFIFLPLRISFPLHLQPRSRSVQFYALIVICNSQKANYVAGTLVSTMDWMYRIGVQVRLSSPEVMSLSLCIYVFPSAYIYNSYFSIKWVNVVFVLAFLNF